MTRQDTEYSHSLLPEPSPDFYLDWIQKIAEEKRVLNIALEEICRLAESIYLEQDRPSEALLAVIGQIARLALSMPPIKLEGDKCVES